MKLTKSIKHHVSMGNYEFIEFGAEVEVEDQDKARTGHVDLTQVLEDMLAEDIKEARLNTDEKKSYIHLYKEEK